MDLAPKRPAPGKRPLKPFLMSVTPNANQTFVFTGTGIIVLIKASLESVLREFLFVSDPHRSVVPNGRSISISVPGRCCLSTDGSPRSVRSTGTQRRTRIELCLPWGDAVCTRIIAARDISQRDIRLTGLFDKTPLECLTTVATRNLRSCCHQPSLLVSD